MAKAPPRGSHSPLLGPLRVICMAYMGSLVSLSSPQGSRALLRVAGNPRGPKRWCHQVAPAGLGSLRWPLGCPLGVTMAPSGVLRVPRGRWGPWHGQGPLVSLEGPEGQKLTVSDKVPKHE